MKTNDLLKKIAKFYPKTIAKKYHDPVGLQTGKLKEETKTIFLCLDFDEIVYDYKSREIVRAIISFGKALNLQVIAEGVVDAKQVEILKKMKCDQIQGFFYSKPIPKKEYESFLMNNQFEKKEDASL